MSLRIELKQVSKQFDSFPALRRVTAAFGSGDRIALLGHNGAGKSTLLNLIATLTKPNGGRIDYFWEDRQLTQKLHIRRLFSYLSHESMLYPDLTALENLKFVNKLLGAGLDEAALTALLDKVGMGSFGDRLFRNCSRGMQQRVSLARALLPAPRLLLLDEPFAGLDRQGSAKLIELLAAPDQTWLMVTHDWQLGYRLANRFWILHKGTLRETLPKDRLSLTALGEMMDQPEQGGGAP